MQRIEKRKTIWYDGVMKKQTITLQNKTLYYELTYKRVKNVNLRISPDGSVRVSAPRYVSRRQIEAFLRQKETFILNALKKQEDSKQKELLPILSEEEIRPYITSLCKKHYPYFEKKGVPFPTIKFRKMVSRWGSCHSQKGILTFNTHLRFAPHSSIQYVVLHELTHFLVPNHSKEFYDELRKVCPDYMKERKKLREIPIRNCF